jgi:hypothetical protein
MRIAGSITCAAEVFLAICLLHRESPEREDFTVKEIMERVGRENLHGSLRPGTPVHASIHCVANRRPNPLAHSMLYATGKSTRRLLRQGIRFILREMRSIGRSRRRFRRGIGTLSNMRRSNMLAAR